MNHKWIILTVGIFLCSIAGSYIGGWASNPSEDRMFDVADSLSQTTQVLVNSVNKIVPVVDQVDSNVQILTKKVETLQNTSPDAIEIHGINELIASMTRLEKKVTGIDSTLIRHDKETSTREGKILASTQKLSTDSDKLSSSYKNLYDQLNKMWTNRDALVWEPGPGGREINIDNLDINEAKRVLCVNRLGETRCLPSVNMEFPPVEPGRLRECLYYKTRLDCGPSKAIN